MRLVRLFIDKTNDVMEGIGRFSDDILSLSEL